MSANNTRPNVGSFLKQTREQVKNATCFVLGNESADLDSMASAVAYAYYASTVAPGARELFVPVMNVPRADYKLRTEATYLMSAAGIEADMLTFIDEVDLPALKAAGGLKLILIDHNKLAASQAELSGAVAGVVDHHKDEALFNDAAVRVIEPVGSCATLVAEALLGADAAAVRPDLATLLLGTILLDTVNLDPEAKRATDKDAAIVARLEPTATTGRKELFDKLQFEKFNVDALDTSDLLRKDYKEYQMGAVRCGIASVLLSVERWVAKDAALVDSLGAFAVARGLHLLVAMNAYTNPEFRRELVVWASDPALRARVLEFLTQSDLGLTPMQTNVPASKEAAFFAQGNAAYSRKKLQPLLQETLA